MGPVQSEYLHINKYTKNAYACTYIYMSIHMDIHIHMCVYTNTYNTYIQSQHVYIVVQIYWGKNPLSFHLSEKAFILSLSLKEIFSGYRILG